MGGQKIPILCYSQIALALRRRILVVSPVNNQDLHGNVPDDSSVVLILIDLINDFEFDGADQMFKNTLAIAQPIARLKKNAKAAGIPVIYVNDNFGKWQSDFRKLVDHCLEDNVKGKPIAQLLKPDERDYFVLKPKHSAFYSTSLDLLLRYLKADTVILTGIAGNICVLFTASDAYMRDFHLLVPQDCIASETEADNQYALAYMSKILKADTRPSTDIDFKAMSRQKRNDSSDKAVRWK
jgi:nicotinamidase-related amidase